MRDEATGRRRIALPLALILAGLCIALAGAFATGAAQSVPAESALRAAVDRLATDGYVARFQWSGVNPLHGEIRYGSPVAYGMRVTEEESDTTIEYLLLDPDLYSREIVADDETPAPWVRRIWHADAPIEGLTGYPPALPLELLRDVRDPFDTGSETIDGRRLRRIDGHTSYFAALIASYNDVPSPTERQQTLAGTLVPLTIWLDEAQGSVARLEMAIPPDAAGLPAGTLLYEFTDTDVAQALTPPDDARQVESGLLQRPGPTTPVESLPISLSGSGRIVTPPPFVTTDGSFRITLTPTSSDLQYQLWRVKRGRMLIAGLGTLVGPGGQVTIPFVLQPGEYVLEVQLPEPADWTLEIDEGG